MSALSGDRDANRTAREVLDWTGVHVLHFMVSSCSRKLRIFLNLKGIKWESHLVDLFANENFQPWFLGINPRGLVPVLVHDGAVHIESNDIIQYLEQKFPTPALIPAGHENELADLLKHEDDLHLDFRTLSFRFVFAPPGPPKPAEALQSYAANGSGTVQGVADRDRAIQIEFWNRVTREGFTDEAARASARQHRWADAAADVEARAVADGRQREHFAELRELGVDLTAYLTQGRADRVIELRGGAGGTHVHLDGVEANGDGT